MDRLGEVHIVCRGDRYVGRGTCIMDVTRYVAGCTSGLLWGIFGGYGGCGGDVTVGWGTYWGSVCGEFREL
jgi:hypothetical protein